MLVQASALSQYTGVASPYLLMLVDAHFTPI
jgi:hypothetical protein